jgi:hypothetical protein
VKRKYPTQETKIVTIVILLKNPRSRFALGAIERCRYENSFAAGKFSPALRPQPEK